MNKQQLANKIWESANKMRSKIEANEYKDYILEPIDIGSGRKAVLSMMLTHEQGVLSALLSKISSAGGSVLTITQSLPIHGKASVTLSLDISAMPGSMAGLIESLGSTPGAEQVRLLAVE